MKTAKYSIIFVCAVRLLGQVHADTVLSDEGIRKAGVLVDPSRTIQSGSAVEQFLGPNRKEIVDALKEIVASRRPGTLGTYDVTYSGAARVLVAVGDDDGLRMVANDLRDRIFFRDEDLERWIRQSGQLKIIPAIADLVFVDEPSDPVPIPPTADIEPPERISIAACRIIRTALMSGSGIDHSVERWARDIGEPVGVDRRRYREIFRNWWKENQKQIVTGNYGAIRPGQSLTESSGLPTAQDDGKLPIDRSNARLAEGSTSRLHSEQRPEATPATSITSNVVIGGVAVLGALILLQILRRKKKRTGSVKNT